SCHGMPRDVLIVRTERVESPWRLWRLGQLLASGQSLLWLPEILAYSTERVREIVASAIEIAGSTGADRPSRSPRRLGFVAACPSPSLLPARSRSRLIQLGQIPLFGRLLSAAAGRCLRLVLLIPPVNPQNATRRFRPPSVITPVGRVPTQTSPVRSPPSELGEPAKLSVIITAHNEG